MIIGTNQLTNVGIDHYHEAIYTDNVNLHKNLIPFHFANMTIMMKRPIGIDAKGHLRWRRSKKNPVVFTHGIIQAKSSLDIMEGYEKWKRHKNTKTN